MNARLLACILAFPLALLAQTPEPDVEPRREAWKYASLVVATLEQGDSVAFPAIRAWLADFHRIAGKLDAKDMARPFPSVNCDALVTHNPRYWAAYYQIPPGDPGLALLHSTLLLSGGEAQRATAIATFGLQRPGIAPEFRYALSAVLSHAKSAQAASTGLVRDGVKRQDEHDFDGALKKYDEAIRQWPGHSLAHYQRGFTLRAKALSGAAKPAPGAAEARPAIADPPETLAALALARRHDPLQVMAYQGADQTVNRSFMPLLRKALPAWDAIRKQSGEPAKRETLASLAAACREAGIDEYALALRQLLVATNGRYRPDDHAFIAVCLRRLAPGAPTESTLALLAGSPPIAMRPPIAAADDALMRPPPKEEFLGPPAPPAPEKPKAPAKAQKPKPKPKKKKSS